MAWNRWFSRILPVLLLLAAVVAPAHAEQCPTCRPLVHTKDIGACKLCGGMTMSGQFKLCMACSDRLQECERCRLALPATALKLDERPEQTFTSGRWIYRFEIFNQGTRSEGYKGTLSFAGQPLPEPGTVNDHVRTPWGLIYWVGNPVTAFGGHGWMLRPKPSQPMGRQVAPPDPAAKLTVLVKVLAADRGRPATEDWILKELAALGAVGEVGVQTDWFPLGPGTVPLHDSKHYGQAALALRDPGEGKPLTVEISGTHPAAVELPRRAGERRVVKHTLASSIASLDLYLAFRVMAP
ncbi:MAG TPA: hypothetical protein VGK03_04570 [Geothrix sp.]|jgi:hypothetical protein